tara:strand:- start:315 stop:848 length:534 start_codon:yes stop_codon:yes gene_type:complete
MVSILKTDKIQASHGSTIEIPSGHNLHAPGHAIQTVQSKWYTVATTTSTSYVAVNDSQVNITPKYADSKFLLRYSLHQYTRNSSLHGLAPYFYVPSTNTWSVLNSDSTYNEVVRVANGNTNLVIWGMQHFEFLISVPGNGTEQVSFKIYHKTSDASYNVRINDNGPGSSISVQEIAQ